MSQQADFYILPATDHQSRQGFMIKLLEQIQSKGLSVLVLLDNAEAVSELDSTLWNYRPDAFLPHHSLGTSLQSPIALCHELPECCSQDVVINLSSQATALEDYPRVVEIIIQDPDVLSVTRLRYQQYRDLNWALNRHDMRK